MPLIVDFPVCAWCGTGSGIFQCPVCKEFTCYDCFEGQTDTQCIHKKYEEKGDNWGLKDDDDI